MTPAIPMTNKRGNTSAVCTRPVREERVSRFPQTADVLHKKKPLMKSIRTKGGVVVTKRTTRRLAVVFAIVATASMVTSVGIAETFVYDYSTVPTASPFPGTAIAGQDNWVDLGGDPTVRNDLDVVPGIDGNNFYDNGVGTVSRINDQNFSYTVADSQLTLSYVARENPSSTSAFALAVDTVFADINGTEGVINQPGELSFTFGFNADRWYIQEAALGAEFFSDDLGFEGGGRTWLIQIDVDLSANGGDGSGSLSVQQLGDTSNNPVADTLAPVDGLQDINLLLSRMDTEGGNSNPSTWDGIYTSAGAGNLDNLTIVTGGGTVLLGDVNLDQVVNGLDVDPFVDVLLNGPCQAEADMNEDAEVNGLDVDLFVAAVVGGGTQPIPEPATLLLCLVALALVSGWRKWSLCRHGTRQP
jgi:hypothetical protein